MAQKQEEFGAVRARLEQQRASLRNDIAALIADNRAPQDDAGIGNHIADDATEVFDRERDLALQSNSQELLAQVEAAIKRIDQGRYGICARCGKPIDPDRLQALPYAIYGVDCQAIIEQER